MSKLFLTAILMFLLFVRCGQKDTIHKAKEEIITIIPKPTSLVQLPGKFVFDENVNVEIDESKQELEDIVSGFLSEMRLANTISSKSNNGNELGKKIVFRLNHQLISNEGYKLQVDEDKISVEAKNPVGLFYATQTLRQLSKKVSFADSATGSGKWDIPVVKIIDEPRFSYRGMHLDVSRHFYGIDVIKSLIDQLARLKLNYFHWHLTDDQGWRIEIKKYPKLTEVGAFRNATLIGHYNDQPHQFDGQRYGGFYSQENIREVVEYARAKYITIIPEIEMPGHAQAAIAAYPYLGCKNEELDVWQLWGVSENVFYPTEKTFQFLEGVLDEVISLFPGKYIHIGGDECPKTQWKESPFCRDLMKYEGLEDEHELQSYFIQRIEKYINSNGKQIIGWDEILEGGLAPNATVMSWRGINGGIEAAKMGHDVIMTPTTHCYFDYYQSDHPDEPLAIGGLIPLEKIYSYEPIPEDLHIDQEKYILGAQANVWTEYIKTKEHLEYMIFPRICALAEVVWSSKDQRSFKNFIKRLIPYTQALDEDGIHVANHLYDLKSIIQPDKGIVNISLECLAKDAEIYYSNDGDRPTLNSIQYKDIIAIDSSITLTAQVFKDQREIGRAFQKSIEFNKATGKNIDFKYPPHPKYSGAGPGSVLNGVLGSNERYGDTEWLGFQGEDVEAVIDFGKSITFEKISLRFFKGEGQWIYLPAQIKLFSSKDGSQYNPILKMGKVNGETKVVNQDLNFEPIEARFLKLLIKNYGAIPDGAQGAGNRAWLFIDEIRVY